MARLRPPRVTNSRAKSIAPLSYEEETARRVENSRRIALRVATAGMDRKALGVEIIDVTGKIDYADFLVLMTGTSDRHCGAIADEVERQLAQVGEKALGVEGKGEQWVLLDYFDVVVHVFTEDARDLYDISGLWLDASRVKVPVRELRSDVN
jgi:ribosome-associated protein